MNKKIMTTAITALMLISLISVFQAGTASAQEDPATYYVSTTGDNAKDGLSWENAKLTIQAAIDVAENGDTIIVANGTYSATAQNSILLGTENEGYCFVKIDKPLNLIGESRDNVILDGTGLQGENRCTGIWVSASNVTVKNLTIQNFTGTNFSYGLYVIERFQHYVWDEVATLENVTAENLKVVDCQASVYFMKTEFATVKDCIVENNSADGIWVAWGSNYATVQGNTVTNSGDHGIWVGTTWMGQGHTSDNATVINNYVNGAREGGISFVASDGATISGNIITNVAAEGWSVGALSLKDGCSNVEAYNNTIYNNDGSWGGHNGTGHGVGIDGNPLNINLYLNNIYGNTGDGCNNYSSVQVTAINNWWGNPNGPDAAAFGGYPRGDTVSDTVNYNPWLSGGPGAYAWIDANLNGAFDLGESHFATIQSAIDATSSGDTIEVAAGTYYETLTVNVENLTLRSTDGAEKTIIDGISFRYMIQICSSDVTFDGFTVTNPDYAGGADASGILIQGTEPINNVQILNNIVKAVRSETGTPSMFGATGINVGRGPLSNIVISGNTIENIHNPEGASSDHTCGINVWAGAENVLISNNAISDIKYNGIILEYANNVRVENNEITGCKTGIRVEPCEGANVSDLTITGNTISDFTKSGILVKDILSIQIEGNTISSTDYYTAATNGIQIGYIGATTGTTGTVSNNQISSCRWSGYDPLTETYEDDWTASGILVIDTESELTISGNEVQNCDVGLDIEAGSGTLITNNDVRNNSYGFVFWNADPTVNFNNISGNSLCGVYRTIDLTGTLDATHNWWGHPRGPRHDKGKSGRGDRVSKKVRYRPWLTKPFQTVLEEHVGYYGSEGPCLEKGWNTFSAPIYLDNNAWEGIAAYLDENVAYRFNASTQKWELMTTDSKLDPLDAIYIRMNSDDSVPLVVSVSITNPPVKELERGWNLVGLAAWEEENMSVDRALVSVELTPDGDRGYTIVVNPPLNREPWTVYTIGQSGEMPLMNKNKAYWVYMENPGNLAGFSTTPLPFWKPE